MQHTVSCCVLPSSAYLMCLCECISLPRHTTAGDPGSGCVSDPSVVCVCSLAGVSGAVGAKVAASSGGGL